MNKHQRFQILWMVILLCFAFSPSSLAEENLPSIIKRIEPSVVVILTYDKEGKALSQGSGFFINQEGDVVTNRHVIQGAKKAEVKTAGGKVYPVKKVIAEDKEGDIVRISIDIPEKAVKPLPVSVSVPNVGERIIVIGNPLGLERTVSDGIVSAVREIPSFGKIIQITAPISEGSSGSPVINAKGEVVGVATFLMVKGQNLNFAIPGERVSRIKPGKEQTIAEWGTGRLEEWLESAEGLYSSGLVFLWAEDCESAISFFEGAIKKNPLYAEAYSLMGYCYANLGRWNEAIEASKKTIRIKPDNVQAYNNIGQAYMNLGRYSEALEILKQSIRIKPDDGWVYLGLGNAYFFLGSYREAIEAYKQAIRFSPDKAGIYFFMGKAYGNLHQWNEALDAYKEEIRIKPDDADTHSSMGDAYSQLAISVWDDYMRKDMVLRRAHEAIDSYKQAVRIKPDHASAHFGLGMAYFILGDKSSALQEYKLLKELDVNLANILFNTLYE